MKATSKTGRRQRASNRVDASPVGFAEEGKVARFGGLSELVQQEADRALTGGRSDIAILDDLQSHGFSREELFELVVSRRSFARRVAEKRLSTKESGRAFRIARIAELADRVFGDTAKAHRWMRKPSPMLEGEVPLTLLKTETGAHLVERTLYRIDYGMFA